MGLDKAWVPRFSLTESGTDITSRMAPYLSSLTYTDNAGDTADQLQIVLASDRLPTPQAGAVLRLGLGFGDQLVDKGQFVVDEVTVAGPPRQITIIASASPMDDRKQTGTLQSQKTRSWDNVTVGQLVNEMAGDNGLEARVSDDLASIQIEHLDQVAESDMAVLTRLAKRFGAVAKPAGGYLMFIKEGEGKSASGRELKSITLTPDLNTSYRFRSASRTKIKSVTAEYTDKATGKPETVTVGQGEPTFKIVFPFPTREEAIAAAEARMNKTQSDSGTMSLILPARPESMALVAESKINLIGFGTAEDGEWRAKALRWTLSGGGMVLSIEGDRK